MYEYSFKNLLICICQIIMFFYTSDMLLALGKEDTCDNIIVFLPEIVITMVLKRSGEVAACH